MRTGKQIALEILVVLLLCSGLAFGTGYFVIRQVQKQVELTKPDPYLDEAIKLNDYYYRFNIATQIYVIRDTLKAIDKYLPKYFPNGPYTRKDLIAMAMVESNFRQYLTGKHGEFGVFQLMPDSLDWVGVERNQFDIDVNTEAALFILQKKHEKHPDYKMGIIAYNGVVKHHGRVSQDYWNRFVKYRRALDDILPNN